MGYQPNGIVYIQIFGALALQNVYTLAHIGRCKFLTGCLPFLLSFPTSFLSFMIMSLCFLIVETESSSTGGVSPRDVAPGDGAPRGV